MFFKLQTCNQSIDKCPSCGQFRIVKNNDCICIDGMYESSVDKQSKLCNTSFSTCANSNYRSRYSTDNFRQFNSGNTCDCIARYYENLMNQNCDNFERSCWTCFL
ncbi:unnamed protein product (macronuclear) [Paramecium tetraurelia]|uniref:Uncharacterized protein n=1 Tax=Paramecium tetraurelia TaxID=5888 RepID=A0C668_PARTE|nr:uncharacterized protein GSPATT00035414001 [Paramecium tetraurelia]CAK66285.1 unnamed protein product [Paramecium tetraurelia]|eukprot:XP_001433682.1 hypothetical protein (macronuclear) [Paramecium tetraurelia strain d4-2]